MIRVRILLIVVCNVVDTSDLEEAGLPLDKYATLKDFFVRTLKEGSRPIDVDPQCLVTGNSYLKISNAFVPFPVNI